MSPTRTAPELPPPEDPVVEDDALGVVEVGPPKSPLLPLIALKKLDGIPVGGTCDPVVTPSVGGFPPLGTTVPDNVTVGAVRGNPYAAHSSAKSNVNPVRLPAGGDSPLRTTGGTNARKSTSKGWRNSTVYYRLTGCHLSRYLRHSALYTTETCIHVLNGAGACCCETVLCIHKFGKVSL